MLDAVGAYPGATCSGTLSQFAGGTAFAGIGGGATGASLPGTVAGFNLAFTSATSGNLILPDGAALAIQRFTAF